MAYTAAMMEKWLNRNVSPFLSTINGNRPAFNTPITFTNTSSSVPQRSTPIISGAVPTQNPLPIFSFIGINDVNRRLCVVLYEVGKIVCCRTYSSYFCISFEFNGCYMARFKYDGVSYVCHIYKNSSSHIDCKDIWNNFIASDAAHLSDVILFNPYMQSSENAKNLISRTVSICGIITPAGECFSSVLDHRTNLFSETTIAHNVPIVTPRGYNNSLVTIRH